MISKDNIVDSKDSNENADDSKKSAHSNVIEVGSVGIEGSSDNGASTLRVLKRKHANDPASKKIGKKPIL